jgi:hypothetical protein
MGYVLTYLVGVLFVRLLIGYMRGQARARDAQLEYNLNSFKTCYNCQSNRWCSIHDDTIPKIFWQGNVVVWCLGSWLTIIIRAVIVLLSFSARRLEAWSYERERVRLHRAHELEAAEKEAEKFLRELN